MSEFESYDFSFEYWERKHGWRVLLSAIRLLVTGKCVLVVNMKRPRDMAMMQAAASAGEAFDRGAA